MRGGGGGGGGGEGSMFDLRNWGDGVEAEGS